MGVYDKIKRALTDAVDVVVDKTTLQAQKSRLKIVIKNEAKMTYDAYVELGKYLYDNCNDESPQEIIDLCKKIDNSKMRMLRAQERYRDVLQEELAHREITETEAKENLGKMKDVIATKAKDTADKMSEIKDSALEKTSERVTKINNTARDKAEEIKNKMPKIKVGFGVLTDEKTEDDKIAEEIFDNAVEDAIETVINSDEDITLQDAIEHAVTTSVTASVNDEIAAKNQLDDEEIVNDVAPQEIYDYTEVVITEEEPDSEAEADDEAATQEIQRVMAVDIAEEEDDEPEEAKAYIKPTAADKVKKLKVIISEHTDDSEESAEPNN